MSPALIVGAIIFIGALVYVLALMPDVSAKEAEINEAWGKVAEALGLRLRPFNGDLQDAFVKGTLEGMPVEIEMRGEKVREKRHILATIFMRRPAYMNYTIELRTVVRVHLPAEWPADAEIFEASGQDQKTYARAAISLGDWDFDQRVMAIGVDDPELASGLATAELREMLGRGFDQTYELTLAKGRVEALYESIILDDEVLVDHVRFVHGLATQLSQALPERQRAHDAMYVASAELEGAREAEAAPQVAGGAGEW